VTSAMVPNRGQSLRAADGGPNSRGQVLASGQICYADSFGIKSNGLSTGRPKNGFERRPRISVAKTVKPVYRVATCLARSTMSEVRFVGMRARGGTSDEEKK
jgi:hypothetical protein